ncbi:MAG: hypothetical protein WD397_17425 [Wenzhouxiangellaceae bacterium]
MKNKLTLIALFALFFAPMLAAVLLHSEWVDWRAAPEKAHGELIMPVVPIGDFRLAGAGGVDRTLDDLRGRWQMVFVTGQTCQAECLQTATLMHNIRLAQDRRQDEVGLVMLSTANLDPDDYRRIRDTDANWLVFDGDAGRVLTNRMPDPAPGTFYIIDPEANIMERFGPGADLNGLRKDLDRLLTWTVRE